MKMYLVSSYHKLFRNTGGIQSSHLTYDEAFEAAEIGQYVITVDTQQVSKVISGRKMAMRIDGDTE